MIFTAPLAVDRFGRYAVPNVPFSTTPCSVRVHLGSGHTETWEQRYEEKLTDYLHVLSLDRSVVGSAPPGTLPLGAAVQRWHRDWWLRRRAVAWFVWLPLGVGALTAIAGLALAVGARAYAEPDMTAPLFLLGCSLASCVIAGLFWRLGWRYAAHYGQYGPTSPLARPGLGAWSLCVGTTAILGGIAVGVGLVLRGVIVPAAADSPGPLPAVAPDVRVLASDTDTWTRRPVVLRVRVVAVDQQDGGWGVLGPRQEHTRVVLLGRSPGSALTEWLAAAIFPKQAVLRGDCYEITGIVLGTVKRPDVPGIAAPRIPVIQGAHLADVTTTAPRDCPALQPSPPG
jgi:hypothetical protein